MQSSNAWLACANRMAALTCAEGESHCLPGLHSTLEEVAMGRVADAIRSKLTRSLQPLRLDIVDESHRHAGHAGARPEGESHFAVTIVSAAFAGQGRVARQRLVYGLLAAELKSDIHALSLITQTPEESRS
jgi:BolA protein